MNSDKIQKLHDKYQDDLLETPRQKFFIHKEKPNEDFDNKVKSIARYCIQETKIIESICKLNERIRQIELFLKSKDIEWKEEESEEEESEVEEEEEEEEEEEDYDYTEEEEEENFVAIPLPLK